METEAMTLSSVTIKSIIFTNSTRVEKPLQSVIISPISMVVAVIGVVGNGFVIWLLSFKIKKNPSTIYIFNLAVADAFFLLCISVLNGFSLGLNITSPMENQFEDDHLNNVVCALSLSCLFGYNTSLCLLTVISVERCICVLFPIWYHCNRPRYLSSIMCTVIWLNSCLFTVFEFVFCFNLSFRVKYLRDISDKECKYTFMIICCLGFIVFIPSMIISSIVLLIKICANSQHRQHRKLYLVITVTVLLFLLFGMPMRILLLIFYMNHTMPTFPIFDIFSMFTTVNSCINPFIYFIIGRLGSGGGKLNLLGTLQAVFRDDGSQIRKLQRDMKMKATM